MTQLMRKKEKVICVHVSGEDKEAYEHMINVLANAVHDVDTMELEGIIADAWSTTNETR